MEDENGNTVSKNIEEIEAGDNVWSRDEATGEECFKPVVETYVRETDTLIHLTYKREARSSRRSEEKGGNADDGDGPATLIGTAEHPFWSLTRNQWVNMGELAVGERLRLDNGSAIVTGVKEKVLAAPVKVYNFQVADHHTYFAAPAEGQPFVWVHNASYNTPLDELARSKGSARARLQRELGSASGDNLDAHHLIPLEAIDDPRTANILQRAARGGFDMNGANNGVLLDDLFHSGPHPLATRRIMRQLTGLNIGGMSDARIAQQVQAIANKERALLLSVQSGRVTRFNAGTRGSIKIR
ncbi:MAG: AHH domain-containing protein [Planctomycetes bacterium]|nr:AHH domain-containing protein [Planctomycetota bacterium]